MLGVIAVFQFPIGVILDSFRKPIPEALATAKEIGVQGIQVYSTYGELSPEKLTGSKRREFLDMVKSHGLSVSALCGDLGHGFGNPEKNPKLIEASKRILDLAKELETDIVTTHIGVVPVDPAHPRYKIMQDACGALAEYADSLNAHFAIETGPETSLVLKGFLDSLHSTGVAVNLDPANLKMVTGDDPVQAVYTLKDYIVHTHAKDGRKLLDRDPEIIYGLRTDDSVVEDQAFIELPLGKGDVDFPAWMRALEDIGYRGFLTIEREVGNDPTADIRTAADFLRNIMA
ncbi:MAG: sugar phosphate isomerase/epimerase [Clostridiales bacterium]|nr:sugar phosphate isomerase/epimerase [Clostridiales bacterium]